MKYLLILLFSFNLHAKTKVEIVKAGEATMSFEKPSLNKAVKRLKKLILSKKRFKGSWSEDQAGNIFKRERSRQVPNGLFVEDEIWNEELGATETIAVPQYDTEAYEQFFKPANFSITITDVTDEVAAKELKKTKRANRKSKAKAIKSTKKKWKDLTSKQKDDLIDYLMDNIL